ncbi:MAG: hypothetical protein ACJ8F2_12650, partial [Xanthobacteraceae bacterium]
MRWAKVTSLIRGRTERETAVTSRCRGSIGALAGCALGYALAAALGTIDFKVSDVVDMTRRPLIYGPTARLR